MSDYIIRELTVGDAEKLAEFYQDEEIKRFYRPYGENISLADIVSQPIARLAADTEMGVVIADMSGNILGHAFLRQNQNNKDEYGFGIGISQQLRGKGYGRQMMSDIFDMGEKRGVKRVTLSVYGDNKKAAELYKRFGFIEVKSIINNAGEEVLYMIKSFENIVDDRDLLIVGQRERRKKLFKAYRSVAGSWFDENCEWAPEGRSLIADGVGGLREIYWHALGMLDSDNPETIAKVMPLLEHKETRFCAFAPFAALQIIHKYQDKLTAAAIEQLQNYVAVNLSKSCTIDFQFHGYNDNMPAMKAFTLLAGGELLGDKKYIEQGLANLCQLRSLFMRKGFLNEFNSPTYSSITLMALSEITNFVKNTDALELAEVAGERVFADIAFHWHRPTSGPAGPFSRAYTLDSVGHCTITNMFMWLLMGDDFVPVNPMRYYFGNESGDVVLHHKGFLPFLQVSSVWHCSSEYLVYPDLVDYMRNSKLPRTVHGTVESGTAVPGSTDVNKEDGSYEFIRYGDFVHPFMNYSATSYLSKRWTLGTSTGYMCDGAQSEVFFIRYALQKLAEDEVVSGVECIRTIYTRYLVNDNSCYVDYEENGISYGSLSDDLLRNQGVAFAFQHCEENRGTAMICTKPVPFATTEPISSLRLRILIYCKHSKPKIIKNGNNILLEDNGMHIMFKPMVNNDLEKDITGSGKIEIGSDGDWIFIDIFNYDGEEREFSEIELQRFCNGFVCEISEKPFDDNIMNENPSDHYYLEQRRIHYARPGVELATDYDPVSMGIRHISINEREIEEPVLAVNDYGVGKLSWINSPYPETPVGFDWRGLIENRKMPY